MKKRLIVTNQSECMACLACEEACSRAFYKEFAPDKATIYVTSKNNAPKTVVCVQCGKCAKNCEYEAIKENAKGVYVIDKKKCTGCGKCVDICPFHVIVMPEEKPSKCIACGICAKACPVEILAIQEKA